MGYGDSVKRNHVHNVAMERVQIVRTVQAMESTSPEHNMTRQEIDDGEDAATEPTKDGSQSPESMQRVPSVTQGGDVIQLQRDMAVNSSIVPDGPTHLMITRSR